MRAPAAAAVGFFWLVAALPAAAKTHGCTAGCVCDGVDLSALGDLVFTMAEETGPAGHEGPDDWAYRISVCEPLPREATPENCRTGIGHPWHAPHVVRYKRADYARNHSAPNRGDCKRVGSDVILATATDYKDPGTQKEVTGVQLVFTAQDGGQTHTVTANLICDRVAGVRDVRSQPAVPHLFSLHLFTRDVSTRPRAESERRRPACARTCASFCF